MSEEVSSAEDFNEEDYIDAIIDDLISLGALVKTDSNGSDEIMYNVDPNRMREVYPEFYEMFIEELDEVLASLVLQGLVRVEYDEQLNAYFSLTEDGKRVVEESGINLELNDSDDKDV